MNHNKHTAQPQSLGIAFLRAGWCACLTTTLGVALVGCSTDATVSQTTVANAPATTPLPPPSVNDTKPSEFPGLHNVVAYHDGFYSGAQPEGDEAFESLRGLGIKTIISVDGAVPNVDAARAAGMRYIHLPIGYNGFDEERRLQLVRATRDAMKDGPVYLHCHHGKHRSAGAAAAVAAGLGWMTAEQGIARMKVSGTAPNYKGLYTCAAESQVLSADVIDRVPAKFPSVWKPATFVRQMVEIDEVTDHLKLIEKAGWIAPPDHPDLVPAAEAGRLADHLRDAAAGERTKKEPGEFGAMLLASLRQAQSLEESLAASPVDATRASASFKLIVASCKDCHAKFRD